MGTAVILTNGRLDTADAKTAHGLIRGTERFKILGVIDANSGQSWADTEPDGNPLVIVDEPDPNTSYELQVSFRGEGESKTLATSLILVLSD